MLKSYNKQDIPIQHKNDLIQNANRLPETEEDIKIQKSQVIQLNSVNWGKSRI